MLADRKEQKFNLSQSELATQFYAFLQIRLEMAHENLEKLTREKDNAVQRKLLQDEIVYLKEKIKLFDPAFFKGFCNGLTLLLTAAALSQQAAQALKKADSKVAPKDLVEIQRFDIHDFDNILAYLPKIIRWNRRREQLTPELTVVLSHMLHWIEKLYTRSQASLFVPAAHLTSSNNTHRDVEVINAAGVQHLDTIAKTQLLALEKEKLRTAVNALDFGSALTISFFCAKFNNNNPQREAGHIFSLFKKDNRYCLVDVNLPNIVFSSASKEELIDFAFSQFSLYKKISPLFLADVTAYQLTPQHALPQDNISKTKSLFREIREDSFAHALTDKEAFPLHEKELLIFLFRQAFFSENLESAFFYLQKMKKSQNLSYEWLMIHYHQEMISLLGWAIRENNQEHNIFAKELLQVVKNNPEYRAAVTELKLSPNGENVSYDHENNNAFHLAAKHDNAEILTTLFELEEKKADYAIWEYCNHHQETMLHLAAGNLSFKAMECLESRLNELPEQYRKQFLNQPDGLGLTPLMSALNNGSHPDAVRMIEKLIAMGADVNSINKKGETALQLAQQMNHVAAAEVLRKAGAKIGEAKASPRPILVDASPLSVRSQPAISILQHAGSRPSPEEKLCIAIQEAAFYFKALADDKNSAEFLKKREQAIVTIEKLLTGEDESLPKRRGVALSAKNPIGRAALLQAVKCADYELVPLLIRAGISLDKNNDNLILAVKNRNLEAATQLVALGQNPYVTIKESKRTTLQMALLNRDYPMTEFIVHYGEKFGATLQDPYALFLAAHNGKKYNPIANILLKAGTNPNAYMAPDGFTTLHWACFHGNLELIEQLLACKASPDASDSHGRTPLTFAMENKHAEISAKAIKTLLHHLAKNDKKISLQEASVAAKYGHIEVIEFWLKGFSDKLEAKEAKPDQSEAAKVFQTALLHGRKEVAELLLKRWPQLPLTKKDILPAAKIGSAAIVRHWISRGFEADDSLMDDKGRTPAHIAAINGHKEVVEKLKEVIDLGLKDKFGKTAGYYLQAGKIADFSVAQGGIQAVSFWSRPRPAKPAVRPMPVDYGAGLPSPSPIPRELTL